MRGKLRRALGWSSVCVALAGSLGCAGKSSANGANELGGDTNGGTGGSSGTAQTGGGGAAPEPCGGPTPAVAAVAATVARVDIPVQLIINASPMTLGTAAPGADGREYKVSQLLFFLTEPGFVDLNGHEAKAQILDANGQPSPYGLQLVNADDPATQLLRLTAPPGNYTALHLGVGVPAACNTISNTNQVYPLSPDSEMTWTWGSQYMFIRIEGSSRPTADGVWSTFAYHVGFDAAFASITVPGAIMVGGAGVAPTLTLDVDRMLATDTQGLPSAQHSVPEGWVVDNLENKRAFSLR